MDSHMADSDTGFYCVDSQVWVGVRQWPMAMGDRVWQSVVEAVCRSGQQFTGDIEEGPRLHVVLVAVVSCVGRRRCCCLPCALLCVSNRQQRDVGELCGLQGPGGTRVGGW